MNIVQQFINNPDAETFKAIALSDEDYKLSTTKFDYPIESYNFWHFIFQSEPHFAVYNECESEIRQKFNANDGIPLIQNGVWKPLMSNSEEFRNPCFKPNELLLESLVNFEPLSFSVEQNCFLYQHFDERQDLTSLIEGSISYWREQVQPESRKEIEVFYDSNKKLNDKDTLFLELEKISNSTNSKKGSILLSLYLIKIFNDENIKKEELVEFSKKANDYDTANNLMSIQCLFGPRFRQEKDNLINPSFLYNPSTNISDLSIGFLYYQNLKLHQNITTEKIKAEKHKLEQIVLSAPKSVKKNKL